ASPGPRPILQSFPARRSSDLSGFFVMGWKDGLPWPSGGSVLCRAAGKDLIGRKSTWEGGAGRKRKSRPEGRLISGNHVLQAVLRSEEHTSELQSRENLVCRLL